MNIKQKTAVLDLFKRAIVDGCEVSEKITLLLMEYGVVCDKNVDQSVVLKWVKNNHFNPNTTFYKTVEDVLEKTRWELFLDQMLHYFTSYTLEMDTPFIVNDKPVDLKKLNVTHIGSISEEEACERCKDMLYSGAALKQDTIEKILIIVNDDIDIDKVKNREAQAIIAVNKGIYPSDAESILRCLIYQATGKTLLIKDRETIKTLKDGNIVIPEYLVPKLAEIFFRFKPLFLAMKKGNQYKINRMRRLANEKHIPFKIPFWNKIISTLDKSNLDDENLFNIINEKIDNLTVYKMVSLYNLVNIKLHLETKLNYDVFITRNGKMYAKCKGPFPGLSKRFEERLEKLKWLLYKQIVDVVKKNVGDEVVKLPLNINLTCPTSEKNFMGEIPLYSWVDLDHDNAIIGIYWREEDGARDLDLSFIDRSGSKIGWNASYYDEGKQFVYSGDMTTANPEATELLYKKKNDNNIVGTVRVNAYAYTNDPHLWYDVDRNTTSQKKQAKYKVFFAKEDIYSKLNVTSKRTGYDRDNRIMNYMVQPDSIIYWYDDLIQGEKMIGTFLKNKFVFANVQTSKKRVSKVDNINGELLNVFEESQPFYLTLDKVLKDAQVNLTYNKDVVLSKDYILKLFQK